MEPKRNTRIRVFLDKLNSIRGATSKTTQICWPEAGYYSSIAILEKTGYFDNRMKTVTAKLHLTELR